jgi:3-oxoacyl-[acyl-carrier protein] reductase
MSRRNSDAYALITGASGGLGRALAKAFWRDGYNLVLTGRAAEAIDSLVKELPSKPCQQVVAVSADLTHPEAPELIFNACRAHSAVIGVLINNGATQGPVAEFEHTDPQAWLEAVMVNLAAPAALSRLAVAHMKKLGWGRIINISGGGASGPRPRFSAYATSKAGLVRFSETLAAELADSGITVNSVAPGAMKTRMLKEILGLGSDAAGEAEVMMAEKVLGREQDSMSQAVDLCRFLASAASDGLSGRLISAVWDDYADWMNHLDELKGSDLYTLRRVTGRDRNTGWGDK